MFFSACSDEHAGTKLGVVAGASHGEVRSGMRRARGPAPTPPEFFEAWGNLSKGRGHKRVGAKAGSPAPAGSSFDELPAGYSWAGCSRLAQ